MNWRHKLPDLIQKLRSLVERRSLDSDQQARTCELTRLVLGTAFACSHVEPGALTQATLDEIGRLLSAAARSTSRLYRVNITDRLNDYSALREINWFSTGVLTSQEPLLRLHVCLRNLGREIRRESRLHSDRKRGLDELEQLTTSCLAVLEIVRQDYVIDRCKTKVAEPWDGMRSILFGLQNLKSESSCEKGEFLKLSALSLTGSFVNLHRLAHRYGIPASMPTTVDWERELLLASTGCHIYPAPVRPDRFECVRQPLHTGHANRFDLGSIRSPLDSVDSQSPQHENNLGAESAIDSLGIQLQRQLAIMDADSYLVREFQSRYVLFVDQWSEDEKAVPRLKRSVIVSAHTADKLRQWFDSIADEEIRDNAIIRFVDAGASSRLDGYIEDILSAIREIVRSSTLADGDSNALANLKDEPHPYFEGRDARTNSEPEKVAVRADCYALVSAPIAGIVCEDGLPVIRELSADFAEQRTRVLTVLREKIQRELPLHGASGRTVKLKASCNREYLDAMHHEISFQTLGEWEVLPLPQDEEPPQSSG